MAATKHDSNADIERGQLFIFINGSPIAFGTSAKLNIASEEVDVSNKMTGGWAASLYGKNSYTITSDSLLTRKTGLMSFDNLAEKQISKETLEFKFGDAIVANETNSGGEFTLDESKVRYTGTIMITSLDLTSDNGQIATCSASFKGLGKLNKVTGAGA